MLRYDNEFSGRDWGRLQGINQKLEAEHETEIEIMNKIINDSLAPAGASHRKYITAYPFGNNV